MAGGHSVGVAHCSAFQSRLTPTVDPTLNPAYAEFLKQSCPGNSSTNVVNLDVTTPTRLDAVYYRNLQVNRGLLTSDQNLQNDPETQPLVAQNANFRAFGPRFQSAMIAMGNINVKTGNAGNIRLNCRKFN
jgi:peroxidase